MLHYYEASPFIMFQVSWSIFHWFRHSGTSVSLFGWFSKFKRSGLRIPPKGIWPHGFQNFRNRSKSARIKSRASSFRCRWNFSKRTTWAGDMAVWSCSAGGRCKFSQKHVLGHKEGLNLSIPARRISFCSSWQGECSHALRILPACHFYLEVEKLTLFENAAFFRFWAVGLQDLSSAKMSQRIRNLRKILV